MEISESKQGREEKPLSPPLSFVHALMQPGHRLRSNLLTLVKNLPPVVLDALRLFFHANDNR